MLLGARPRKIAPLPKLLLEVLLPDEHTPITTRRGSMGAATGVSACALPSPRASTHVWHGASERAGNRCWSEGGGAKWSSAPVASLGSSPKCVGFIGPLPHGSSPLWMSEGLTSCWLLATGKRRKHKEHRDYIGKAEDLLEIRD